MSLQVQHVHPNSGMIEEDGVFVMDGDTTNFEDGGCGVSNGFGGYNRRHVRSKAELLPWCVLIPAHNVRWNAREFGCCRCVWW